MKRYSVLIAALGTVAFGAVAAEQTLVCRGRVTESSMPAQKRGDTAADTLVIDDATRSVVSGGRPQPVTKFTAQAIEIMKVGPKAKALITIDRASGAYALRLAGDDPPVKLTILGQCRNPAQAAQGERIGAVAGSVYTSPALGIVVKIPEGWETQNAELEQKMAALADEMLARPLLTLTKLGKEKTPEAMLIITAEKLAGDLTATDYVEAARAVSRKRAGVTAVSEVTTESIGPKQFAASTITMGTGSDAMFVKTYARIHRDNVLLFVLTYNGARQRYESEQLLGAIQYQ